MGVSWSSLALFYSKLNKFLQVFHRSLCLLVVDDCTVIAFHCLHPFLLIRQKHLKVFPCVRLQLRELIINVRKRHWLGVVSFLKHIPVHFKEHIKMPACLVHQDWLCSIINLLGFSWNPVDVIAVSISVVLVPLTHTHWFAAAIFRDELLKTERHPNVEETDARHYSKPVSGIINITRSVVPVESKHTANSDSPLQGLECWLKFENVFQFQRIILATFLFWIVVKQILFRRFILSDVCPSKLVDFSNFLCILFRSFIEICRGIFKLILLSPSNLSFWYQDRTFITIALLWRKRGRHLILISVLIENEVIIV